MAACKIGEFAKSKAGHDKNQIFIIINIEGEYVFLVDGKSRNIDRPKKKKLKHIQPVNYIDCELQRKLDADIAMQNEDIKRAIKSYCKKISAESQNRQ